RQAYRDVFTASPARHHPARETESSDVLGINRLIRVTLADQTVAYKIPDKPNSRLQQYRITDKGIALLAAFKKGRAS
ncbi:MAG: hypothetical protein WCF05_09470, partial [Chromatiaceae bacterium]